MSVLNKEQPSQYPHTEPLKRHPELYQTSHSLNVVDSFHFTLSFPIQGEKGPPGPVGPQGEMVGRNMHFLPNIRIAYLRQIIESMILTSMFYLLYLHFPTGTTRFSWTKRSSRYFRTTSKNFGQLNIFFHLLKK